MGRLARKLEEVAGLLDEMLADPWEVDASVDTERLEDPKHKTWISGLSRRFEKTKSGFLTSDFLSQKPQERGGPKRAGGNDDLPFGAGGSSSFASCQHLDSFGNKTSLLAPSSSPGYPFHGPVG